jgi:hypothetical protein
MKPEDLLGKGAFEKKKTISADIELKASELPYAIIPCTFYPDTENSFSVSVTPSTSPSDVRLRACADDWRKAVASVRRSPPPSLQPSNGRWWTSQHAHRSSFCVVSRANGSRARPLAVAETTRAGSAILSFSCACE